MKEFIEYCKDYIAEHLGGYEGQRVYTSDLGWIVTEGPNADGTLTYSRELAKDYLREWWYEASDYFQYEKDNFGTPQNPFENPEAYMVCMVIEGCRSLIDNALNTLDVDWNDEIELTADLIEKIKGAVEEFNDERLF